MAHQKRAIEKLAPIRVGALFMEMGTGKSRTAIELVLRRQDRITSTIWYCPVSLKETIRREILKHTDCAPADIHVFDAKTCQANVPDVPWYVIGIESMSASSRVILTANAITTANTLVILDEAQYIKGHRSKRSNWITDISRRTRYRLILTGTPISQGIEDLYAQMRFLSPKILGYASWYKFRHSHLVYSEKFKGMIEARINKGYLADKIRPYVYQVTKEECMDLPVKMYENRYFSMGWQQHDAYEQAKNEILLNCSEFDSVTIFRLFTALQQITSGYWNRTEEESDEILEFPHSRAEILIDILRDIPENEPVVIWAKYQYDMLTITEAIKREFGAGLTAEFHGQISQKKRRQELDRFSDGNARYFVATPSSGGHGLNELVDSAWVVFYNNGFKYSERIQAEDRNHRHGQKRPVTYIDITCSDSIDDRINAAIHAKGNAVESFREEIQRVKDKRALIRSL